MTTRTENIASVSSVGHCVREKPEHDKDEPDVLRMANVAVGSCRRQLMTLLGTLDRAQSRSGERAPSCQSGPFPAVA
jgi:hypothetical protein